MECTFKFHFCSLSLCLDSLSFFKESITYWCPVMFCSVLSVSFLFMNVHLWQIWQAKQVYLVAVRSIRHRTPQHVKKVILCCLWAIVFCLGYWSSSKQRRLELSFHNKLCVKHKPMYAASILQCVFSFCLRSVPRGQGYTSTASRLLSLCFSSNTQRRKSRVLSLARR